MKKSLVLLLGAFLFSTPAWAYSDRVDASVKEIYAAALSCFEKEGIYKSDPEKGSLTTKWVSQTIRRDRKRRFVPTRMKETVDIRYQMKLDLQEGVNYSDVSIIGRFEEKLTDGHPMQPWRSSPSDKEFYFKERAFFFKLLGCIEANKKAAAAPSNSANSSAVPA